MALRWLAVACLGVVSVAAFAGEVPAVRRPLAPDVVVDWTALAVEVRSTARHPTFRNDLTFAEQAAFDQVATRVATAVEEVPVRDGVIAGRTGEVGSRALAAWSVAETRYVRDGRVEVVGRVSLAKVLEPWMSSRTVDPPTGETSEPSGVLIDARGLPVDPCFAPRVLGPDGVARFEGVLWHDVAGGTAPARWVTTPADPRAAEVAGDEPVLLSAAAVDGCTLTLDAPSGARWDAQVAGARVAGEGRLVLVVDP